MGDLYFASGSLFANRFEIDRPAGSGGMATVYRACDRYSGQIVALKLLHSSTGGAADAERFAREAQILAEQRHPGIVAYVAHGQTPDGQGFLAMEWLDGEDLSQRLMRGPLPLRDCMLLLGQVAEALVLAHQRGVIHRDIKPSNLFLVGGQIGAVKVLDFGIARRIATSHAMTQTGMVVGTPEYMAPEQARGIRELTPAADVFSLGCVLYECLTGQPPFIADHVAAVLVRILFEEPVPLGERNLGIPEVVAELVGRLLSKDPAKRPSDASAVRAELMALGDVPETALAATMVSSKPLTASFAAMEQSLLCVVLAAPSEQEAGLYPTLRPAELQQASDRDVLQRALQSLGVSAYFLASGAMVVVSMPSLGTATDQAVRAARAALMAKERWPATTVAMATGRGAIRGRTAVGEVVELAARLLKAGTEPSSHKGTIGVWVDALSAKLLEGHFVQTALQGGVMIQSEERDVDASRPLLGKPTPCVGRETELAYLEAQLTDSIEESDARVMVVTAPPGIGKSRLRHEYIRRLEKRNERVTCMVGRGHLMSAGVPYDMLRDAIRKLCGISGSESLDTQRECLRARVSQHLSVSDQERVVLFVGELCNIPFLDEGMPMLQTARQEPKIMGDCLRRALRDWLAAECAAAPVLLILDDLQWGDELTVAVLDEVLRVQSGAPLLVLSFARPEIHEIFPKLWQGHRTQELQLKGLSKKACERFIQQVLGTKVAPEAVARAVEQSAGNPLFLEELIRSIAEGKVSERPETVLAMLQARIGRLDTGARRTLRAASVYGQTFWPGGIAAILGLAKSDSNVEVWLAHAQDAELIQQQLTSRFAHEKEYSFRHSLVRDAAYSLLTASDLTMGHRLAGEYLEAAADNDAAVIADHFERSGDKGRAASWYLRAAEDSAARGNFIGALRHVDRGLACATEREMLGQLRSVESYVALRLNQDDRIGEASQLALNHLRAGSLSWCRAMSTAIHSAINQGNRTRGLELVSSLLDTEPDVDAWIAYVFALGAIQTLWVLSVPATRLQSLMHRISFSVARAQITAPSIRRCLHHGLGLMSTFREPRPWTAIKEFRLAIELHDQAGDTRRSGYAREYMEENWRDLGDVEGAQQRLSALEVQITQSQDMYFVCVWRCQLARTLCESEDEALWSRAERLLAPLLSYTGGFRLFPILAQGIMARVALLRGLLRDAEAQARAAMRFFSVMPAAMSHVAPCQIRALIALGSYTEATVVASQGLDAIAMLGGLGITEVEFRLAASEAFHSVGDAERARKELRETLRQIQLRAEDITDAFWKNGYLTKNPYCVRARLLAQKWKLTEQAA